jgi:hypothetical protein
MQIHPTVTPERVIEACQARRVSLDNPGFCVACGADAMGVEPDARNYECESCGERQVFGAEELLLLII